MKTLIFLGAARKNGHTKKMVDLFINNLEGEIDIIDAYRTENIAPCKDCRYCWHKRGCSIKDNMQNIYEKIDEADNIVFASPMYFHTVPAPLKQIIDRCQVYWAGMVRGDRPEDYIKKGAVLMVGGAPDFTNQFAAGSQVLKGLLGDIGAECLGEITMPNSDKDSLETRPDIVEEVISLAKKMNEENK